MITFINFLLLLIIIIGGAGGFADAAGAKRSEIKRELRGSQGMGVVNNDWCDSVLLNSLHVQTLMLTDFQTPFLGTPLVPLKRECNRQTDAGVCEQKQSSGKEHTLGCQPSGQESSFCCWVAGQGLAQKEFFFTDAGITVPRGGFKKGDPTKMSLNSLLSHSKVT